MAITLFLLATYLEKDGIELNHIFVVGSNVIACLWLLVTIRLTSFIHKPKEAARQV